MCYFLKVLLLVLLLCNVCLSENVEIPADYVINDIEVWDEDVHLNGHVFVDGILIIHPGVNVYNSYNGGIVVNEGGIISAVGTSESRITFSSDTVESHYDYEFAIKIIGESSSSIEFCNFVCAYTGIWLDQGFLNLKNNLFYFCNAGVYIENLQQNSSIINNEFIDCCFAGIGVTFKDPNVTNNNEDFVAGTIGIINNTIVGSWRGTFGQAYGIYIEGVLNADNAGTIIIANNVIVGSNTNAITQINGYMFCERVCNAYGLSRISDINEGNPFEDANEILLTFDPFIYSYKEYPLLLDPCCELIDAGCQYVWDSSLIGTTTHPYGFPDNGVIDIGYHYIYWDYFSPSGEFDFLQSDINQDNYVDCEDLMMITMNWLKITDPNLVDPNYPEMLSTINNISGSAIIDLDDFDTFQAQWLMGGEPMSYQIELNFDKSIYSLDGYVFATGNFPANIVMAFLFIDGRYYARFNENSCGLQTDYFSNGSHSLKVVMLTSQGETICSMPQEVIFNNFLSETLSSHYYNENGYNLTGVVQSSDFIVKVDTWEYVGNNGLINITIPQETFGNIVNEVMIEASVLNPTVNSTIGNLDITTENDTFSHWSRRVYQQFDIFNADPNSRALIMLPFEDVTCHRWEVIDAEIQAFQNHNIKTIILYYRDVNWDNISYILTNMPIAYIAYHGHGNSEVVLQGSGGVPVLRTSFPIWEMVEEGIIWDDWEIRHVFSFLQSDGQFPPLPGNLEQTSYSMNSLGLCRSKYIRWVFIDSCKSAYYADMASACGAVNNLNSPYAIYTGWKIEVIVPNDFWNLILKSNEVLAQAYQNWDNGNTWFDSLVQAGRYVGKGAQEVLWGQDGEQDGNIWLNPAEDSNADNIWFVYSHANSLQYSFLY